ncbi:spermidine/putrescine ABC transporter membrane protein [Atlantibacter hermannii]|nr:spermidine/putrescine ABC transporter membrane protein [Atlantibacter hermannii]
MMSARKFQNVVIATIVGWLLLFVFLPNLMIIGTSFLTRDDAHFVSMVFSLDNYARLLDPLYFQVLLHSLNMALIATVACLVLGYPFAWFLARLPERVRPLLLFLLIVPFWTNSLIRIYGLKLFLSTKGYLNEFLLWLGVIDAPIRIMYTPSAVIVGLVYILLPFMVMPLYSSIEKLDKPLLEAARDLGCQQAANLYPHHPSPDHAGDYRRLSAGDAARDGAVLRVRFNGRREKPAYRQRD